MVELTRTLNARDEEIKRLKENDSKMVGEIRFRDDLLGKLKQTENELKKVVKEKDDLILNMKKNFDFNLKNERERLKKEYIKRINTVENKNSNLSSEINKLKGEIGLRDELLSRLKSTENDLRNEIKDLTLNAPIASPTTTQDEPNVPDYHSPPPISPAQSMVTQVSEQDSIMAQLDRELGDVDENKSDNGNTNGNTSQSQGRFRLWNVFGGGN